jgi:cytochrome c-type protein NapB
MKAGVVLLSLLVAAPLAWAGQPLPAEYDSKGNEVYEGYARMNEAYRSGGSSDRTLQEYYSRRQYPGSPPYIPHRAEEEFNNAINCLSCHTSGGWVEEFGRHAPVTPHPEKISCRQCHVQRTTIELFRETDWASVPPPRLGGSLLPGSPPPVPHRLQMRENCLACHAGPGAVTSIRSEHADRGNCRQCHVPQETDEPFQRKGP